MNEGAKKKKVMNKVREEIEDEEEKGRGYIHVHVHAHHMLVYSEYPMTAQQPMTLR